MYKIQKTDRYEIIILEKDGFTHSIPKNIENVDYQEYLNWLAQGNEPEIISQ